MTTFVLALPRLVKRILVLTLDISLCVLTVWLAFYLRLNEWVSLSGEAIFQPLWAIAVSLVLALPLFITHGFYRIIFHHSSVFSAAIVIRAFVLYSVFYATVVTVFGLPGVPHTIGIIQPLLLFVTVTASRALAHYWLGERYQNQLRLASLPQALVYGAGSAGRQLVSALKNNHEMHVIGFLDDDDRLQGHVLNGQPIFSPNDLASLITSKKITHILLAIPSANRQRRNEILQKMGQYHVIVRTLPSLTALAEGRVTTSDLQELDVDDLLGRGVVDPEPELMEKNIQGKIVLVTGAGGSIGSELCRQIIKLKPEKLLLLEINEYALYTIHTELEGICEQEENLKAVCVIPLLASVQDKIRILEIIKTYQIHTIYHTAAYKHVPLVEHNLTEGVRNNVMGTLTMAQAALEKGVSDFVLISTDKAVRPTNVMGASKRLAELCLQSLFASYAIAKKTRLSMVRFGNVLDSSGSVIPRFRQQILHGGPITLTHPEITRYFMTIPEAAQLVIQAGAMAEGGDVFVLDMGKPLKIADLAERMIKLSGLSIRNNSHPSGDIEIVISGLRPGEKLYEELLLGDNPQPTDHPKIQRAQDPYISWNQLEAELNTLNILLARNDVEMIVKLLKKLVTGYQPGNEIVDYLYRAKM